MENDNLMVNTDVLANNLIAQLLKFDWPYKKILEVQLKYSKKRIEHTTGCFRIRFMPDKSTAPFPAWLSERPILWQIPTDDAPILGQLFVKDGYVSQYEVIDFAFKEISWEQIWNTNLQLDVEYNRETIFQVLSKEDATIRKIVRNQYGIDIELLIGEKPTLVCFKECTICNWQYVETPFVTRLQIEESKFADSYSISLRGTALRFQCQAMYLQYHSHLCVSE